MFSCDRRRDLTFLNLHFTNINTFKGNTQVISRVQKMHHSVSLAHPDYICLLCLGNEMTTQLCVLPSSFPLRGLINKSVKLSDLTVCLCFVFNVYIKNTYPVSKSEINMLQVSLQTQHFFYCKKYYWTCYYLNSEN